MKGDKTMISGTREWASHNVNICNGCSHDCRYCYARSMAVRFKRRTAETWHLEEVDQEKMSKSYRKRNGTIMFPTTHDITPNILDPCLCVLEKILVAGNRVLIVSKPHLECIKAIIYRFLNFRDQILFRFTIGAFDSGILKFWEPGAPIYQERWESLKYAFSTGFQTSVSIEPMLDPKFIWLLVDDLERFVTNSIWIGKMNQIRVRVKPDGAETEQAIKQIEAGQTDDRIREIYGMLKDHPLVKWKDSIKQVMGLELAEVPGLDE